MATTIDANKITLTVLADDPAAPAAGTIVLYGVGKASRAQDEDGTVYNLGTPTYRHFAFRPAFNIVTSEIEWTVVYNDLPDGLPAVTGTPDADSFAVTLDAAPADIWAGATNGIDVAVEAGGLGVVVTFTGTGNVFTGTPPQCEIRLY